MVPLLLGKVSLTPKLFASIESQGRSSAYLRQGWWDLAPAVNGGSPKADMQSDSPLGQGSGGERAEPVFVQGMAGMVGPGRGLLQSRLIAVGSGLCWQTRG
jgi:hypothetical protein